MSEIEPVNALASGNAYGSGHGTAAVLLPVFCYQLTAKPGNKTSTVPWYDPYIHMRHWNKSSLAQVMACCLPAPESQLTSMDPQHEDQWHFNKNKDISWKCLLKSQVTCLSQNTSQEKVASMASYLEKITMKISLWEVWCLAWLCVGTPANIEDQVKRQFLCLFSKQK